MSELEDAYSDRKILVTGGAGSIGTNLTRKLSNLGAEEIIILDNLSAGYRWNIPQAENITFIEGDILNPEELNQAFRKKPDIVFHLAAHFANQNSVEHPITDLTVNGKGTLQILQQANLVDVDRFVYASSGCGIYGHGSTPPFTEDDFSMSLDTPYQVTKMLGELYTNYFHNYFEMPIANARFFNSFGPGEVPGRYRNVIPNFTYWAMNGQELPITGDGSETRDWTYVMDIVDGLLAMGHREEAIGESFNLATGQDTTVRDMATLINDLTGNDAGIKFTERRNWDNKTRIVGSIEKSQKLLGYEPQVSFKDGVQNVYDWFTENREEIWASAEF